MINACDIVYFTTRVGTVFDFLHSDYISPQCVRRLDVIYSKNYANTAVTVSKLAY